MCFCPFCGGVFDKEVTKYDHMLNHQETKETIKENLAPYSKIKELVGSDGNSFFNSGRKTHQFLSVVLNATSGQYSVKLSRLEKLLSIYSDRIISSSGDRNVIKSKARSDFFTFFSELELLHGIVITFSQFPEIPWKMTSPDIDFVLSNENLAIELKTPIGTAQRLSDYVNAADKQKQLATRSEQIKLLAIDTTYSHQGGFPMISGELNGIIKNRETSWNSLLTFSTFHQKYGYYFKTGLSEENRSKIIQLSKTLAELWTSD